MTLIMKKTLFVLLLAVSALGCDPYYRHHHRYRSDYDSGYYGSYGRGGYRSYSAPYYGPNGRNEGEHHHHHDSDHDDD